MTTKCIKKQQNSEGEVVIQKTEKALERLLEKINEKLRW